MKNIKTYEGFFDFLKKKEKIEVTFDDVMECLYDLTDEHRIKNELNGDRFDGIFADEKYIFKRRPSMSLGYEHDALMNDEIYRHRNFKVRGNSMAFEMIYSVYGNDTLKISDAEVNELLLDCKSKLEIYGCKISFFIGWGRDEGSSSEKEWTDFMSMINKTIMRSTFPQRPRNITIKITSPTGFTN